MGFQKSYVIFQVGHGKCLRLITRWVGGVKKGPKHAYVIFEWSLSNCILASPLLAVSVLYVEKNQNKILRNNLRFLTSRFCQIAFLMTYQQH